MFSALAVAFSYITAITYGTSFDFLLAYFLVWEFILVIFASWFILKHVFEFGARKVIGFTASVGWLPTSLLLMIAMMLLYPPQNRVTSPDYFNTYFYTPIFFSLFHCIFYGAGAFVGTLIPMSFAVRLRRKILFIIPKFGDEVNVLELAEILEENPSKVKATIVNLLKEGYIVGRLHEDSGKLHLGLRAHNRRQTRIT